MMRLLTLFLLGVLAIACVPVTPPRVANVTAVTARPSTENITPSPEATDTTQSPLLERCDDKKVSDALKLLPQYTPSEGAFVQATGTQLVLEGAPFIVYGLNYYPRNTPFWKFLTETEVSVVDAEMDIIQRSGFNTLRVFIRYQDMFICYGNGAVPFVQNMTRLDNIIKAISEKGVKLIVVLHHDPNTSVLYSQPDYIAEQTRFIVSRYQDEPSILAWDLRDKGDLDYRNSDFTPATVLSWLAEMAFIVRQSDPNHLITAGWWEDSVATAPFVDFVSFQHYGEYEPLRQAIAILRDQVRNKPILLSAIGYSTFSLDETAQRNLLYQAFGEVSTNQLAGWLIYMAFDYPTSVTCQEPACPAEMSEINRYGIWNTSYFPKLALEAVERTIEGR